MARYQNLNQKMTNGPLARSFATANARDFWDKVKNQLVIIRGIYIKSIQ